MNAPTRSPSPPAEILDLVRQDPGDAQGWLALGRWMAKHLGAAPAAQQVEAGVRHVRDPAPLLEFIARTLQATPSAPLRISALNRLARLRPEDIDTLAELGHALARSSAAPQALRPLQAAYQLGLRRPESLGLLASLELAQGQLDQADQHYDALLALLPDHPGAWAGKYLIAANRWDWRHALDHADRARQAMVSAKTTSDIPAHVLLSLYGNDPPALIPGHRRHSTPGRPLSPRGPRLRLAFLSSDFRSHAIGFLIAGLFELLDRQRVEVFVYNDGPRTLDAYRSRIQQAAEHFTDLNDLTDVQAAARMAQDRPDILIELTGHTLGGRPEIASQRVAPIQMHYLGFAGSLNSPGIDYYLADALTVPPEGEAEFTETVLRLPRCFMVTDDKRPLPRPRSRQEEGLPEEAIVLINYNQSWKITQPYVELWLDALARHPKAVLWLRTPGPEARGRLLAMAQQRGVKAAESRIIDFGYSSDSQTHLDRISLADLAVDQLPYSSHSIGAELLWAGVPLLTQLGVRFAGRVGASLVQAVGEPSFIVESLDEYAQKLDQLLRDPEQLRACQQRLRKNRHQLPLFDTAGFARDFEALLFSLYE